MGGWMISILTGMVAAGITGWVNYRLMKSEIKSQQIVKYKELITAERIKWIHELRIAVDELIADSTDLMLRSSAENFDREKFDTVEKNFIKNRHLVILMLNPEDDFSKEVNTFFDKSLQYMGTKMAEINGTPIPPNPVSDMNEVINIFSDSAQILLKNEWEKVKREAANMYGLNKTEQNK